MPDAQLAYLLLRNGALQSIAFSEGEAMANRSSDEIEIAEWPINPLRPLPGGLYEYATEQIATDTADLGKLTSIDTLMEVAFIVRGREGWKCINVLPGLFGEKCFPPGVTMVWGRDKRLHHPWSAEQWKAAFGDLQADPIGPDPAGETA